MTYPSPAKKGLTVKDLVTIGIFSALFLVFALIGGIFFAPRASARRRKYASFSLS